jgi:outer membrane protein
MAESGTGRPSTGHLTGNRLSNLVRFAAACVPCKPGRIMKVQPSYARILLLVLLLSPGLPAMAETKAGYLSVERILKESGPGQRGQKVMDAEFAPRDREIATLAKQFERMKADLEKDLAVLSDPQRAGRERALSSLSSELQRKQREYSEDLNQRRSEESAAVMQRMNAAVRRIAEQEGYDIVFHDAVWVDQGIDITDKVIKAMNEAP